MVLVFGSINITADGRKAIVTLSAGDMRRSLNILQVRTRSLCVWILCPVKITSICPWRFSVISRLNVEGLSAGHWTWTKSPVTCAQPFSCDLYDPQPAPSVVVEHQHGVRGGYGGDGLHLHRSPSPFRHRQHSGLVPQQGLHHCLQTYPSPTISGFLWLWRDWSRRTLLLKPHTSILPKSNQKILICFELSSQSALWMDSWHTVGLGKSF